MLYNPVCITIICINSEKQIITLILVSFRLFISLLVYLFDCLYICLQISLDHGITKVKQD